ncbi:MAG: toprim domain-containing protein [Aigarchaeota archaeon]|nr:toprim domain-containing protein [Candidatus Wolframiiraptor gerlachensis]
MLIIGKYRRIELLEEFEELVENLRRDSEDGVPIIVEGERDVRSLRILGIMGEIIPVKSIRGLRRRLEAKDVKSVILLFDLDQEGEKLMRLVKRSLEGVVGEINTRYWLRLKTFKKLGFTQVEHLHLVPEKIRAPSRGEEAPSRRRRG